MISSDQFPPRRKANQGMSERPGIIRAVRQCDNARTLDTTVDVTRNHEQNRPTALQDIQPPATFDTTYATSLDRTVSAINKGFAEQLLHIQQHLNKLKKENE